VRIVSLVPSATETLYALGLGDSVVGVTHECDYPPEAAALPHLTSTVIPEGLTAREIDDEVRERTGRGEALYELDNERLHQLEPDLIVTQALCAVCAVSVDDVRAVAKEIVSQPEVLSLDPTTLGEVLADVRTLGMATESMDEAENLLEVLADRIDDVTDAVNGADRPVVAALEWLDPPWIAGHWVPQLVELAGGIDVLGHPGENSRSVQWEEVYASEPEVIVAMPCGYDTGRSADEVLDHRGALSRAGASRVYAVDAAAYFSRPGPRLVDGLELLAHILHPDRVDEPPPGRFARLDPAPVG
jgi:iron complex transport system substrate-binding protein